MNHAIFDICRRLGEAEICYNGDMSEVKINVKFQKEIDSNIGAIINEDTDILQITKDVLFYGILSGLSLMLIYKLIKYIKTEMNKVYDTKK